ncbi:transposase [Botrimarina mediterranea]|uniref:transposase n=1 Tax=Botrimarina mediterranea TaxID=2528022 RepID=UPI0036F47CDB
MLRSPTSSGRGSSRCAVGPRWDARGGRPREDNRACLEVVLWMLSSGARWRHLPERYPSPSTCWRRLGEWQAEGILDEVWQSLLVIGSRKGFLLNLGERFGPVCVEESP